MSRGAHGVSPHDGGSSGPCYRRPFDRPTRERLDPVSETTGDLTRAFARQFWWMLALALLVPVGLWALGVEAMRDLGVGMVLVLAVIVPVVLGPLSWLRHEHRGRNDRAYWGCLGLSVLWAVVSLVGIFAVFYVIGSG